MDASIFESALSHTGRSDASKIREESSVSTFGRFRLWISFESSPVSVNGLKWLGYLVEEKFALSGSVVELETILDIFDLILSEVNLN